MSETKTRIPLDHASGKYRRNWEMTQEEQVTTMSP
jgi:hypothetical protein